MYNRSSDQLPHPPDPPARAVPAFPAPVAARHAGDRSWEELAIAAQVWERLGPCLHMDDLLGCLPGLAIDIFPHSAGLVYARNRAEARLQVARIYGFDAAPVEALDQLALAQVIAPWQPADGPLHVPDLRATKLRVAGFFSDHGLRSLVAIPVAAGAGADSRLVLLLAGADAGTFGRTGLLTALNHFQRAVAIPLANALYVEERERGHEDVLGQATGLLNLVTTAANPVAGLGPLLDLALHIGGADAGTIMVVAPETRELYVRASRGMRTRSPADRQLPWASRSSDPIATLTAPSRIQSLGATHGGPDIPVAPAEGFRAYLGVPIAGPGAPDPLGLLNLYWRRDTGLPDQAPAALLQSVAQAAALLLTEGAWRERGTQYDRVTAQLLGHQTATLSLIGHELRTPITAISGFAQLIARRAPTPDSPIGRYSGTILQECRRLGVLIDNVLHLTRLEGTLLAMQVRPFSLIPLLQDLHTDPSLGGTLGAESLVWDLQDPAPIVVGDPLRLKQVLVALLRRVPPGSAAGRPPSLALRRVSHAGKARVEIVIEAGVARPAGTSIVELMAALDLRQAVNRPEGGDEELSFYAALHLLQAMGAEMRTEQPPQGRDCYILSLAVLDEK